MVPRILLCLALLSSCGCATLASRQACNITSNPPGASIYLVSVSADERGAGTRLGTTPYQKPIQQGPKTSYLRAELAGYEPAQWQVPDALGFSHHFELEPAISTQVAGELSTYPREYVRGAVDVLGKCDEVLTTPRWLQATAVASANTANEQLKLDFPDQKSSVLARRLDQAIDELRRIGGAAGAGEVASSERGSPARAEHLINEIK